MIWFCAEAVQQRCRRVQGLLEEQEAETTVQPADVPQQDSGECTAAAEPDTSIADVQWKEVLDPPQAPVGETHAQFWHRHFAHVRNKGRLQIQVCALRSIVLELSMLSASAVRRGMYACRSCFGNGCKGVARLGPKFRCLLDSTTRLYQS